MKKRLAGCEHLSQSPHTHSHPYPLPPIPNSHPLRTPPTANPTHAYSHSCLSPPIPTPIHGAALAIRPAPLDWSVSGPLTFVPQTVHQQSGQKSHCALTMTISNPRKKGLNKTVKFQAHFKVHWLLLLATRWKDRLCRVLLRLQCLHGRLSHQQALGSLGDNCCSAH